MYQEFRAKAVGAGAELHRFETGREALDFILFFLKEEGVADAPGSYAVWGGAPSLNGLLEKSGLPRLSGLRFEVTRSVAAQAKFGVSQMEWGVADTGSLVQDQSAPEQRLVSSLPEIHIALLPTGNIVADKVSLFARVSPKTSRYLAFITGPSRTADIERVLTIGVHGPRRLIVVLFDAVGGGR